MNIKQLMIEEEPITTNMSSSLVKSGLDKLVGVKELFSFFVGAKITTAVQENRLGQIQSRLVAEIEKTDLVNEFKPIFRPPAWKMSPDSLRAADDWGVEILALTPDIEHGSYGGAEKLYESKIVYYNVNPPFNKLKLYKKTEMVYHACEWDDNYLSKELTKDLESFLLKKNIKK